MYKMGEVVKRQSDKIDVIIIKAICKDEKTSYRVINPDTEEIYTLEEDEIEVGNKKRNPMESVETVEIPLIKVGMTNTKIDIDIN